ncbi:hypothetical protein C4588_06835 [Candidatus Parcubacteria bacterium]|nr:MAG: hypothetical protein C4588_06835 [Candidatus Parcubacteria bacterium]
MTEKTYQLTLTEKQLQVLVTATDLYARIICGQFCTVAEQFIGKNIPYENLHAAQDMLTAAKTSIFPEFGGSPHASHSIRSPDVGESAKISYDIEQVLRHRLSWDSDNKEGQAKDEKFRGPWYDLPWKSADEPLPVLVSEESCSCKYPECTGRENRPIADLSNNVCERCKAMVCSSSLEICPKCQRNCCPRCFPDNDVCVGCFISRSRGH